MREMYDAAARRYAATATGERYIRAMGLTGDDAERMRLNVSMIIDEAEAACEVAETFLAAIDAYAAAHPDDIATPWNPGDGRSPDWTLAWAFTTATVVQIYDMAATLGADDAIASAEQLVEFVMSAPVTDRSLLRLFGVLLDAGYHLGRAHAHAAHESAP